MQIETVIEAPDWEATDLTGLAQSTADALAVHLDLPAEAEATLLGTDDVRIGVLNAEFRGKPAPTNVLSWPSAERATPGARPAAPAPDAFGDLHLGDMAISYDTCAREAAAQGKPMAEHVTHLVLHGMLHLLGYDHETGSDAALMEEIEREILGKMGIPDPY